MERIVVKTSRAHWLWILLGSLAFVSGGVFILHTGDNAVTAWGGIVFFGGCALVAAGQILDRRPRLVIDDRGVLDRTLKIGVIDWHDINGAFVKRLQGNAFICLELRDPAKYTGKLSPLARRLSTMNRQIGFTDISLNLAGTDLDAEQVCELVLKEAAVRAGRLRSSDRAGGS